MIGLFAVTDAGRRAAAELAARWREDAVVAEGPIGSALRRLWPQLDAAVLFLATGAAVRLVGPMLRDKQTDPGVVCVDEARHFAVALAGGHAGGANALAEQVADVLGCQPVVTTATDSTGSTPLDEIVELLEATVEGDLASCGVAILDGAPVRLVNPHGFALPALPDNVSADTESPQWTIVVDDRRPHEADPDNTLRLIPRTLVVGIGSASDIPRTAVTDTLARLDGEHGLDPRAIRAFATVDLKAAERGILDAVQDMGFWNSPDGDELPLRHYPAQELAEVRVPHPSEVVRAEVGTPSVAEAAALRAAGELGGGAETELVADKIKGDNVTVAAARIRPRGRLAIVGLGPGAQEERTPRADAELRRASVVVGLDQYIEQVRHLLRPGTEIRASGLGSEEARAADAVSLARCGRAVALIGSGDAGVYAMASPALEQAGDDIEVVGVAGVTSALATSSLLGAPLGHDHALISLSDLHTPWEVIERRVRAAAEGDLVVCFYNPRSAGRHWHLGRALEVLGEHRPARTPVGAVRQAGRDGQRVWWAPIDEFDPAEVDMLTTVVVGSSHTTVSAGRMVTPRGYRWMSTDGG
ncbi:cobalt-precorrin 5A hydrolase/precorrin-3B C17-methyltransferase [Halopolyspora algeriensis]|uniref:Cobalt-precorrin 5A hydrolase/precorrin-3B C17-methyltransferase n=1 Tax=Halopolyspora algeriensis TaxID=1500506 RepID=A0A368VFE7_9ACTN|nr:precorrin-3B C(17)-methyltransferase [Halopolyspora algeriensis]RCW39792.1 cobalt-precorrin 5A hydrolase/precorrin-3B C17-methyltransferase [Halopolyspora algeriensis]TQM56447.1 cobalt-precorrin 5A hydrolase/precorrin-3B C17-methyltransferase [Halopolyspora algeriensis]